MNLNPLYQKQDINYEFNVSFFERLILRCLQFGKLPRHMGVIMDGNRRYAKSHNLSTKEGHRKGSLKFVELLKWSCIIGIEIITVYAFSLENFKRDRQEVYDLFDLFLDRLNFILNQIKELGDNQFVNTAFHGYHVRFCGDKQRLPEELQDKIKTLESYTRKMENPNGNGKRMLLNICVCYTSTNDIHQGINKVRNELERSLIKLEDIDNLKSNLFSADFKDVICPDLIFRTGGNSRLSEFLTFQSAFSFLSFNNITWPQLNLIHFVRIILDFQLHYPFIKQAIRAQNMKMNQS
ncbi:hypothetical protein GJ496_011002 [Pomphorhynchus laevis]|nr:hypothetical protein GJ496_011002 [Pomphorhynchus laevis]